MSDLRNDDDDTGFWGRHGFAVGAGVVAVAVVGGVALYLWSDRNETPTRKVQPTVVTLLPPPPPPPPQVQPQKMIEQPPIKEQEQKPPEKPLDKPPPPKPVNVDQPPPTGPLGLDQKPTGPGDNFNLAANPGGNGLLGGGGGGGSPWGWYGGMVQSQIEEALRANKKTRSAQLRILVRLWPDNSGRIVRVQLGSSTGDPALDDLLVKDVLMGMQLREPPPKDMPLPIVTRFTERRPI
jgi:outer membrane biosynthesis protein TonB